MAAVLRQGEHIPKMQNDIGHKITLRMLQNLHGFCKFPLAVPHGCRVALRLAAGSARLRHIDAMGAVRGGMPRGPVLGPALLPWIYAA